MSITFIYQYNKYKIYNKNINTINEALINFLSFVDKSENELLFLYKGKKINNKISLNKLNNMIISVFNIKMNKKNKECYIRCPTCQNLSHLNINKNNDNKYNISINNCINNHEYNNLSINEFFNYQNNIKIECDICKNNKNLYNDNFYICSCGKYICKLCLEKHNIKNHNIIEYNRRYDTCNNHEKEYISYCKDCKLNLCENCEEEHYKHKIIIYKMLINKIKIEEMKKDLNENINKIKEYKEEINLLNEIYNNIMINYKNDLDDYINLINKIIYYLNNLNNYETINNVLNFKLEILNRDIDNYFMNENIKKRMIYLIDIIERYINQIDIIYEINKEENKLNIFGSKFVENNKKCLMMIDNKINEIKENHIINNKKRKNLKILLFTDKALNNMSYMFYKCEYLLSLSEISKWNTNNVTNMSYIFFKCKQLSSLSDISNWNTNNVTDMSYMFTGCESLSSIPDISKWNTNNVSNMSYMFDGCYQLSSLPDISKWNINNVTNMSYIFYLCEKLSSLPDISKWNTNNVTDMSYMFCKCKNLLSLPDISSWNTNNVTNISYIFYLCEKLSSLPDISKWNTNNVTDMSYIFCKCIKLSSLPDISKWNTNNLTNMTGMFKYCEKLLSLPDISKWNTNNVTGMSFMFYRCYQLTSLPKFNK